MAVFPLMQVAPREREWSSLTGVEGEAGGYIATTIYSLCPGSFCNEMACVMEALSKQWAYSTWRGVSVRTRLNTIPLIQGCNPGFFRSYYFLFSLLQLLPILLIFLSLFPFSPLILCFLPLFFLLSAWDIRLQKQICKKVKKDSKHTVFSRS